MQERCVMRKDLGVKPWLCPMPVLMVAAYGEDGVPNAMPAAWGGIHTDDMVGVCLADDHKTTRNILARKAFTVSMASSSTIAACDYLGIVSGDKVPDKLERAGFHVRRSALVDAPLIEELPLALECELVSYDAETCYMVGRILNVSADESILGEDGRVDVSRLDPVVYEPFGRGYFALGDRIGTGYSSGKKID
jgi:flavin reductase (DIM6/NTAB) family NADH-FMN oxidoreductase RutF